MTQAHSDRRGATSRASLLAAARKLFSDHGFHGTSVGDIADRAGLRKPSLFHHFATKDALYRAVMLDVVMEVGAAIALGSSTAGTYAERLDAVNDALTDFLASRPEAARLLFREALEPGNVLREEGVAQSLAVLGAAAEFLREGIRAGEFVDQDPKQLVLSLTGVHLTFFALAPLATPFLGVSVFGEGAAARKAAVRAQARAMVCRLESAARREKGLRQAGVSSYAAAHEERASKGFWRRARVPRDDRLGGRAVASAAPSRRPASGRSAPAAPAARRRPRAAAARRAAGRASARLSAVWKSWIPAPAGRSSAGGLPARCVSSWVVSAGLVSPAVRLSPAWVSAAWVPAAVCVCAATPAAARSAPERWVLLPDGGWLRRLEREAHHVVERSLGERSQDHG